MKNNILFKLFYTIILYFGADKKKQYYLQFDVIFNDMYVAYQKNPDYQQNK